VFDPSEPYAQTFSRSFGSGCDGFLRGKGGDSTPDSTLGPSVGGLEPLFALREGLCDGQTVPAEQALRKDRNRGANDRMVAEVFFAPACEGRAGEFLLARTAHPESNGYRKQVFTGGAGCTFAPVRSAHAFAVVLCSQTAAWFSKPCASFPDGSEGVSSDSRFVGAVFYADLASAEAALAALGK
jgi:hypothetical protein